MYTYIYIFPSFVFVQRIRNHIASVARGFEIQKREAFSERPRNREIQKAQIFRFHVNVSLIKTLLPWRCPARESVSRSLDLRGKRDCRPPFPPRGSRVPREESDRTRGESEGRGSSFCFCVFSSNGSRVEKKILRFRSARLVARSYGGGV